MKILKIVLATTALVLSSSVNAAVISGSHTLSNGNSVNLSGLEWLDLYSTQGMSRGYVESQLNEGGEFDGWRIATRNEMAVLLQSLWGGTAPSWHTTNFSGADWLNDNFGALNIGEIYSLSYVNYGEATSCSADTTYSCFAHWLTNDTQGYFSSDWGLQLNGTALYDQNTRSSLTGHQDLATALVREVAPVPIPAAVWLFGSGVIGLVGFARPKKT